MSVETSGDLMPEGVVRMLAQRAIGGATPFRECRVIGPLGESRVSRLFRCIASGRSEEHTSELQSRKI
jgi:hypothetical protein